MNYPRPVSFPTAKCGAWRLRGASSLARTVGSWQALEVESELFVAQLDLLLEMIVIEQLLG